MMDSVKVILVKRETAIESWKKDSSTLALGCAFVAIGVILDSAALQWMGAFVWFILVLSQANKSVKRLTISEARKWLDDLEATPNE